MAALWMLFSETQMYTELVEEKIKILVVYLTLKCDIPAKQKA